MPAALINHDGTIAATNLSWRTAAPNDFPGAGCQTGQNLLACCDPITAWSLGKWLEGQVEEEAFLVRETDSPLLAFRLDDAGRLALIVLGNPTPATLDHVARSTAQLESHADAIESLTDEVSSIRQRVRAIDRT